jgi:hypothetical protein
MKIMSEAGNLTIDAGTGITTISGNQVFIDAKNVLTLKGLQIVRDDGGSVDDLSGSSVENVGARKQIDAASMGLGTSGRLDINAFGGKSETIGGASEETIGNVDVALGNVNAKLIKAMVGKIVLETIDAAATGGIELNQGPGGSAGTIQIGKLGDITIGTLTGTGGITLQAVVGPISITTPKEVELVGVGGVTIGSSGGNVDVEAQGAINLAGTSEPAILGKAFSKLFEDHTHPSPNGPTGPLSPKFAPKIKKAMARKVFLA